MVLVSNVRLATENWPHTYDASREQPSNVSSTESYLTVYRASTIHLPTTIVEVGAHIIDQASPTTFPV